MTHCVYRHWGKDGVLLYVGCSSNLDQRTASHKSAHWFKDIVNITHEDFATRKEALEEEKRIIQDEMPKYNRHHHLENTPNTAPLPELPDHLAKTVYGGYTIEYIRQRLSQKCYEEAGSVLAWCKKRKIAHSYVSGVIRGVRKPSQRLLKMIGIKITLVNIADRKEVVKPNMKFHNVS